MAPDIEAGTPAVLSVSSLEEDHLSLRRILGDSYGKMRQAGSCGEALEILHGTTTPVVICERGLPDGDWKEILYRMRPCEPAPLLIVSSRLADELLWAEVLNLGGWDVLAKPFEAKEVIWSVSLAWREWNRRQSQPASTL